MKLVSFLSLCFASALLAQEPLTVDAVIANRALWPKEVTVNVQHQVPIIVNGKSSGSMQANPGRVYTVKSVDAAGVHVDAHGAPLTFPATDTDLLVRSTEVDARLKSAATAAPAATPAPVTASVSAPAPQTAPAPAKITNSIAAKLSGKLVSLDGKKLQPFDAKSLESKKYLAVYFSASWCPPCRKFTPELVSWYKRKKGDLDKFDIIFVSSDKTDADMLGYMVEDKMAWPALAFDKKPGSPLRQYSGRGIPCLVILDEHGQVLSHSYENGEYIGPTKVLKDLDKLLKSS